MEILIVNGPNLNLLGSREPEIYGTTSMEDVLQSLCNNFPDHQVDYFQSNSEGEIITRLQQSGFEALIINPGALTHYSYALADALKNLKVPKIEVHLTNLYEREEFRRKSVTAPYCSGIISGFGTAGYALAINALK